MGFGELGTLDYKKQILFREHSVAPQKNSWRGTWLPKGVPHVMHFIEIGAAQRHEWAFFFVITCNRFSTWSSVT